MSKLLRILNAVHGYEADEALPAFSNKQIAAICAITAVIVIAVLCFGTPGLLEIPDALR